MGNKMKNHKGLAKRFKVTGKGKLRARKPGASHLLSNKSGKQLRNLRKPLIIQNKALARKTKELMGD
jgi:large subunit ribosomal protein L35